MKRSGALIAALALSSVGIVPAALGGLVAAPSASGGSASSSANWAGYVVTPSGSTSGFTGVAASWTVPPLIPPERGAVAEWVGLGGFTSDQLVQAGVLEEWAAGQPVAVPFVEQLPAAAVEGNPVPVASGTTAAASVTVAPAASGAATATLTVTYGTETLAQTVAVDADALASVESSADWIVEAPSTVFGRILPLARFGSVAFSGAAATAADGSSGGLSAWAPAGSLTAVDLAQPDGTQAAPGAVSGDGFTVTETTPTAPNSPGFPRHRHGWPRSWREEFGWGWGR